MKNISVVRNTRITSSWVTIFIHRKTLNQICRRRSWKTCSYDRRQYTLERRNEGKISILCTRDRDVEGSDINTHRFSEYSFEAWGAKLSDESSIWDLLDYVSTILNIDNQKILESLAIIAKTLHENDIVTDRKPLAEYQSRDAVKRHMSSVTDHISRESSRLKSDIESHDCQCPKEEIHFLIIRHC